MIKCACGSEFETRSTTKDTIMVEICAQCHPFYTGKQKLLDTAGRIDRFRRKYGQTPGSTREEVGTVTERAEHKQEWLGYSCFLYTYSLR